MALWSSPPRQPGLGSASSKALYGGRAATRADRWSRTRGRRRHGHPQAWGLGPGRRGAGGVSESARAPTRPRGAGVAAPLRGQECSVGGWRLVRRWAVGTVRRGRSLRWPAVAVGPQAAPDPHSARPAMGPHALHPCAWCRISGHRLRSPGHGGIRWPGQCPRGWRWSVPGRPGRPRPSPAPQHRPAADANSLRSCLAAAAGAAEAQR